MSQSEWSNLAKVVYKRTYAREDNGILEKWEDTVERIIKGNIRNHNVSKEEVDRLRYFILNRKCMPAGRGLWFSGAPAHERLGGVALSNCWTVVGDDWKNLVLAQDLLMLGGGVGLSVEHKYVSKLPKVKKDVSIFNKDTKDADFIIPDSRDGWNQLTEKILKAFFETGEGFSYSTVCIRGAGEAIKGFGGKASGPRPLIEYADKLCKILKERAGKHVRPIDLSDMLCAIGEMVVSGNVRRSAIIIVGDPFDKEYLKAKRWDLGQIPTQRAMANFSVNCSDIDDLHPLFWKTYEQGEPFGIVNMKNINKYGRMGELKKDTAQCVNPCFAPGTMIQAKEGHFPIESLVGKKVDIWNGNDWQTVDNFRVTAEDQPILKITFQDGSFERLTPYHSVILENGNRIKAKDLKINDALQYSDAPLSHGSINTKAPYLKGFILGDGYSSNEEVFLNLYHTKFMCEGRLIESAKELPKGPIRTNAVVSLGFAEATLQNRKAMQGLAIRKQELLAWGKEYKENLPSEVFQWNEKSKCDLIAGFFDADGSAQDNKGGFGYQVSSINKSLLSDIQSVLITLGIKSKLSLMKAAGEKDFNDGYGIYSAKDCWRLTISQKNSIKLSTIVTFSRLISFDKKQIVNNVKSKRNIIVDIQMDGIESKVYCCTVPGKHALGLTSGLLYGQCGESSLESKESCNLQEIFLPNIKDEQEFIEAAKLMHRWGKRVACEKYHHKDVEEVIYRNRRVGTGITGCLQSPLFNPDTLDKAFAAIQEENGSYSKELGIPESIRTTVVKPSGTLSLLGDCTPGIHAAYSKYYIRRVRFSANDNLIPLLKAAGHSMEPVQRFDGSLDHNTLVVDFYCQTPEGTPVADAGFDTWKQLEVLKMAQKHWSDQAVSVTVYYKKEEIPQIKQWLTDNLDELKTISFLCHNDHGFKQAPLEAITEEEYLKLSKKIKPINVDAIDTGDIVSSECEGGACPIR